MIFALPIFIELVTLVSTVTAYKVVSDALDD